MAWEYLVVSLMSGLATGELAAQNIQLNELGREGWELISVASTPGDGMNAYLRRAVPRILL